MKLIRYLKPFYKGLILALVLLFVQAICNLSLPDFMSDIVNVGIQQNGIENALPRAISPNDLDFITKFMTKDENIKVRDAYILNSVENLKNTEFIYEDIDLDSTQEVFILKKLDKSEESELENMFSKASATLVETVKDIFPKAEGSSNLEDPNAETEFDSEMLKKLMPILNNIPTEKIEEYRSKVADSDAQMSRQIGILISKSFFENIGGNVEKIQRNYIYSMGKKMVIFAIIGGIATISVNFLASRISTSVARELRKDIFNKIESFSSEEFDKFGAASLITRSTNDISQMRQLIHIGIRMVCYAPIMGIGGVIMALKKSASMSWIIGVAVITILGFISILMSIAMPKFKRIQKLLDRLNLVARENLSGIMVIRAFGTEEHELKRFRTANEEFTGVNLSVNRIISLIMPLMMLIMNGLTVLIIWVGAHHIAQSSIQIGDMMAYMQYAMQVLMSFMLISIVFIQLPQAAVSANRISDVLETELSIKDPDMPIEFDNSKKGYLEFKNVNFKYDDAKENALCDISFLASPGKTTAIIGSTGSGKSTIASLALRFYDISSGEILLNGVDIRKIRQEDLRDRIGFVPQKAMLLSGTVAFNLKYGNFLAKDELMYKASRIAQASDFIENMEKGFDSNISQGGVNVSGGQKQRLSIARAIVKEPEILIFDDSFSALDFKTDAKLRKALNESIEDQTVIIIAQRISSIMNADEILVLDNGKIVGRGSHEKLLKTCKHYREIAASQMGEEVIE